MATLGQNLMYQHNYAEAEPLLREAASTSEKIQPDLWTTFNRRSLLGGALLGQARDMKTTEPTAAAAKLAEAEQHLVAGYEGLNAREQSIPAVSNFDYIKQSNASLSFTPSKISPTKSPSGKENSTPEPRSSRNDPFIQSRGSRPSGRGEQSAR